jgi:hypothetical protein
MGWASVKWGLRVLSVSVGLCQAEHERLFGCSLAVDDRKGLIDPHSLGPDR